MPGSATSTVRWESPAGSDVTAGSMPLESAPAIDWEVAAFMKSDAADRMNAFASPSKKTNGLSDVSVSKLTGANSVSLYVTWYGTCGYVANVGNGAAAFVAGATYVSVS